MEITQRMNDAVERLKIQWGTSLVYPLSSMGAHVSNSPNHQTGRSTPIETRFHTAMFGAAKADKALEDAAKRLKDRTKRDINN